MPDRGRSVIERLAWVAAILLLCGGVAATIRPYRHDMRRAADIAYGPDHQERLDVYGAPDLRNAPVAIFIHGGAYAFGDKNERGGLWGNVAETLAHAGLLAINADYRLLPRATWPAGIEDVARLVAWARANARRFGGDPHRIVLIGHSAGATHVAGYLFDRRFQPGGQSGVAGAVLVSGRYTLAIAPHDANARLARAYFGLDPAQWPDRAPIAHLADAPPPPPLMVVVAGRENASLADGASALRASLCARGACPTFLRLAGESHLSEMANVGTRDRSLSAPMLGFILGLKAR
jgi:acetyl esterase/lipase